MRLKQLRIENNLRQSDVAKVLKVTPEAYSMWETGVRQPSLAGLITLSSLYGVTLEYLVGITDARRDYGNLSTDEERVLGWYNRLDNTDRQLLTLLLQSLAGNKKYNGNA